MPALRLVAACTLVALVACTSAAPDTASSRRGAVLPEGDSPAFLEAATRHAAQLAALPDTAVAGLWLLQDSTGHELASGIAQPFPTGIADDDYTTIVPASAGYEALAFGFARTSAGRNLGSIPVVYVTVTGAVQ